MIDNIEIAILTKVNELAEKCGLKPYEFVAVVESPGPGEWKDVEMEGVTTLSFDGVFPGQQIEKRVDAMCKALGVGKDGTLRGKDSAIIDALDHALQRLPTRRRR